MLEIKEYVKVESLEQAFELNQKRTNQIIGGMLWMKMGDHRIQTPSICLVLVLIPLRKMRRSFPSDV